MTNAAEKSHTFWGLGPVFLTVFALASVNLSVWAENPSPPATSDAGDVQAHISFPYDNALVRANVPIFGIAWAKDFQLYRVEFGEGEGPKQWTLIKESTKPETNDPWAEGKVGWNPDWGVSEGNLGLWETGLDEYPYGQAFKHNLRGIYTLRLTIEEKNGQTRQHSIKVNVGRIISNWLGGFAESPDASVRLEFQPDSLKAAFALASLLPTTDLEKPANLICPAPVYEFQPPSLTLIRSAIMRFKLPKEAEGEQAVPATAYSIHYYGITSKTWIPVRSAFDANTQTVFAEVTEIPAGRAFFILAADVVPPDSPKLVPLPERTGTRALRVKGSSEANSTVILNIQGKDLETRCAPSGEFSQEIRLSPGINTLRARGRDLSGNLSADTQEFEIVLEYRHPKNVKELSMIGANEAYRGATLLVKLTGDNPSDKVDSTLVRINSSQSDPQGFVIEAREASPGSGMFIANFEIGNVSDPEAGRLKAVMDGETITAAWEVDAAVVARKIYRDREGPTCPVIRCENQEALEWQTFEGEAAKVLQSWKPMEIRFAPVLSIQEEQGNSFLRIRGKTFEGQIGSFGATAWEKEYSLVQFPIISFDFRAGFGTEIDMVVYITAPNLGWEGFKWKGIGLTDYEPYFPRLRRVWEARADGHWRPVEINLLNLVRERYPNQPDYRVGKIVFGDWDGASSLFGTKVMGKSARHGGAYDIDKFYIGNYSTSAEATFRWETSDGVDSYQALLDQSPQTALREKDATAAPIKQSEEIAKDGETIFMIPSEGGAPRSSEVINLPGDRCAVRFGGLRDGQWWLHLRARDKVGNWSKTNHYRFVRDTGPPSAESPIQDQAVLQFPPVITLLVKDEGAGVDPSSIKIEFDGRVSEVDEKHLTYQPNSGCLALNLPFRSPYPFWFIDGQAVSLKLKEVADYAGNRIGGEKSWSFKASSVVVAQAKDERKNGWFVTEPGHSLAKGEEENWSLVWMRSLKGDSYGEKGCYIRELGLIQWSHVDMKKFEPGHEIPIHDGKERIHWVSEVKVDKSEPETQMILQKTNGPERALGRPLIALEHSEYAYRRGGLKGRYFRTPDFKDLLCERVDPVVYFHDDREAYTRPAPGARSARWEGAVYIRNAGLMEFELALWKRSPASGRAFLDGEALIELLPKDMAVTGYKKQKALLTEGLHRLSLEFVEPEDRDWQFVLFYWTKGGKGEDVRETFGPRELYYLENLGTTYYQLNKGPVLAYDKPFESPLGRNLITFWTTDEAGNIEEKKTEELTIDETEDEEKEDGGDADITGENKGTK